MQSGRRSSALLVQVRHFGFNLEQRPSCPDDPQASTATAPAKVARHVPGHRLPGAVKIAEAVQLLKDEFWKEMIDPHS